MFMCLSQPGVPCDTLTHNFLQYKKENNRLKRIMNIVHEYFSTHITSPKPFTLKPPSNLGVSEPVLLLLQAHGVDDDLGHPPVPLLQVQVGGGARRDHHGGVHGLDVEAAVPGVRVKGQPKVSVLMD